MGRLGRRHLLAGAGAVAALGVFGRVAFPWLARPPAPDGPLSEGARKLLDRAWEGLDPARVLDCHVHVVGLGTGGTGCWVNPRVTSALRHPVQYARFSIYKIAAGIDDMARADQQYVERLLSLARWGEPHGRLLILAFDQAHREDGTPDPASSEFFVPNDYVLRLAAENPDAFVPAASIHPYRKDAAREVARVADLGAAAVKWLPNAQLIDPSSPRCDAMYAEMVRQKLPLLTHTGLEQAVEADEAQKLGNPLLLRRALDAGVRVIACHCATSGMGEDLDAAGGDKPLVDNFELFTRLCADKRYEGRIFGDVSALIQFNRCEKLGALLRRSDLHPRLVNGSDYPLPAINVLVRTGKLESLGYITAAERGLLNEIDRHDPIAFDLAVKRTVRVGDARFPDAVFMARPGLFRGV